MEPKFSLESEGAVAGSSAKWLVSCWQQMGATALFVSVAFCFVFNVFFPTGPEVTLGGELGMCELQAPLCQG